VLSNIELPALRRKAATDKLVEKIVKHDSLPIQPDILHPPLLWLTSRKPLWLERDAQTDRRTDRTAIKRELTGRKLWQRWHLGHQCRWDNYLVRSLVTATVRTLHGVAANDTKLSPDNNTPSWLFVFLNDKTAAGEWERWSRLVQQLGQHLIHNSTATVTL